MCDCEMPDVFDESKCKARKGHKCCECRSAISRGESYFILQGLWDGQWRNYKQCVNCNSIGHKYQNITHECYPLGDLIQELINSDFITNQKDDDDKPDLWETSEDWLLIENHNPLKLGLK